PSDRASNEDRSILDNVTARRLPRGVEKYVGVSLRAYELPLCRQPCENGHKPIRQTCRVAWCSATGGPPGSGRDTLTSPPLPPPPIGRGPRLREEAAARGPGQLALAAAAVATRRPAAPGVSPGNNKDPLERGRGQPDPSQGAEVTRRSRRHGGRPAPASGTRRRRGGRPSPVKGTPSSRGAARSSGTGAIARARTARSSPAGAKAREDRAARSDRGARARVRGPGRSREAARPHPHAGAVHRGTERGRVVSSTSDANARLLDVIKRTGMQRSRSPNEW
ncbi:hypothetical protein THAOC_01124, partial [Thalassiosira oceanica]